MESRKRGSKSAPGISFEQAVAAVQRLLDPTAEVVHDERLVDRLGHARQFDVVIRARAAGHPVLGVIECKDTRRKVDAPQINAFADKSRNVNANLTLFVSRSGFTRQAIELAKFHGIGTFSLVKEREEEHGIALGIPYFATVFHWASARMTLHFARVEDRIPKFSFENVLWRGVPFYDVVVDDLNKRFDRVSTVGWFTWTAQFSEPEFFAVEGKSVGIVAVVVELERRAEKKRKMMRWMGRMLYDWQTQTATIPPNTTIVTEGWRTDMSDWEDFDGEFPPMQVGGLPDMRLITFMAPTLERSGLPEITNSAEVSMLDPTGSLVTEKWGPVQERDGNNGA